MSQGRNDIVTLVIDYCQNLDLPHVGEDQPGETYYFSPIALYCLGIVDSSTNKLFAYLYPESAAKKGANNTASCLLHYLKNHRLSLSQLSYNCPLKELNLIMDNCGGQNKNNVFLKTCAYIMEAGWFESVNVTFLSKDVQKTVAIEASIS